MFDTGEHGTGGRLGTRALADRSIRPAWVSPVHASLKLAFDHAGKLQVVCIAAKKISLQIQSSSCVLVQLNL